MQIFGVHFGQTAERFNAILRATWHITRGLGDTIAMVDELRRNQARTEHLLMTKIDDVIATIQAQSTMISGVQALVANLRQTVADLTAQHGADAELQAKIDEAFQDAQSNSAALAQAIATTPDGSAAAPVHVEDFTTAEQPPAAAPQADTSGGEPRG